MAVREYLATISGGSLVDQRAAIAERVAAPRSPQDVAKKLGLSLRSMQRAVNESGTSYEALLGDVRKELACAYLRQGKYSVLVHVPGDPPASPLGR